MNDIPASSVSFADRVAKVLPWVIGFAVLLGIGGAGSVRHAPSLAWWLAAAAGLWLGWPAWRELGRGERTMLVGWGLVLLAVLVSLIGTEDLKAGKRDIEKYLRVTLAIPLYLTLRRFVWPIPVVTLVAAVIGGLALMVFGYVQVVVQGQDRALGVVHWIYFGDVAVLTSVIILVAACCLVRRWQDLLWAATAVAGLIACVFSKTRNAYLALPAVVAAVPLVLGRRLRWWMHAAVYCGGVLLVVGALLFAPGVGERMREAQNDLEGWFSGDPDRAATSLGFRLTMWQRSLELWQTSPVTGIGCGDYRVEMKRLTAAHPFEAEQAILYEHHAHSHYIQILTEQGIFGFIVQVGSMLVLPFIIGWRAVRRARTRQELWPGLATCSVVCCWAVFGIGEDWTAKNGFISVYLLSLVPFLAAAGRMLERDKPELVAADADNG